MGRTPRFLVLLVLMTLVLASASVSAAVDWEDSLTDPAGDVEDDGGNTVPTVTDVDIVSVSITEQGTDVNITMVLAGPRNETGSYTINVEVDDGDSYTFSWFVFGGFVATDPDFMPINVWGAFSADNKTMSWVVAKAAFSATEGLEIQVAMAFSFGFSDYAGMPDISDFPIPSSISIKMSFDKLNVMELTMTSTYTGENATNFRKLVDDDSDGTITQAEVDKILDDMGDDDVNLTEGNLTLDGKSPTTIVQDFSLEGAIGAVDRTTPISVVMGETITFPDVEKKSTHVYAFDPFGEDFIGGDEPWENKITLSIEVATPDGWVFDAKDLPAKMKDYANKDKTQIKMEGQELRQDWNATFRDLESFTVKKESDDGDDGPGFPLLAALAALGAAGLLSRRRR